MASNPSLSNPSPGTRSRTGKGTLYRSVADHVESLIDEGTLAPGMRIPSLRRLSRQLSVSLSTVSEAYRVLEDRGIIETRPQSGHYVRLIERSTPLEPARTRPSGRACEVDTARLMEHLVELASRPDIVAPFGAAVPHPEFLPVARLNTLLARAVRREPVASQSYDSLPGRHELRVQIARRAMDAGCSLAPDDLVITTGAMEAITLALRAVTKPGDTVAIETPTYHGFLQVLEALHLKALEVATDPRDGICLERLEEVVDQGQVAACLLVPSFGNPLGQNMPEAARKTLVDLLARADVPLIEDDTYGDLPFGDHRPKAVKSFDRDGRVLLLSSFSKALAPGYRVGWIAPGRYLEAVRQAKFSASMATAVPTQMAIADYLAGAGMDRHLRRCRRRFKDLVRRMIVAVGEYFPPGTRVTRPSGGYLLWVEMPEAVDAMRLHTDALQEGISLIPGSMFSTVGSYGHCLRISCAMPWSDSVEDAVRRVGELARGQLA